MGAPAAPSAQAALQIARQVREQLAPCVGSLQERAAAEPAMAGIDAALLARVVGGLYALEASRQDPAALLAGLREAMTLLQQVLGALQEHGAAAERETAAVANALARIFPIVDTLARAAAADSGTVRTPPSEPAIPLARPKASPRTPASDPPPLLLERRAERRATLEVGVGFHSENNFYTGFGGDVSQGGLFVATYDLLPAGSKVHLTFWLPDDVEVAVQGEVAWIREPRPDRPPGMGIRFSSLPDDAREAIERFVARREPIFHDE